jgi:hypothetical protein
MNGDVWCTNGGLAARTAANEARHEAHGVHAHDKLAFRGDGRGRSVRIAPPHLVTPRRGSRQTIWCGADGLRTMIAAGAGTGSTTTGDTNASAATHP